MDQTILSCIKTRTDFFETYYTVPENARDEVARFAEELTRLGEVSADATDFEARFAAGGMQERFVALLARCQPKPYTMTDGERAHAEQTARQMAQEDRGRRLRQAGEEALDYASVMAQEELIARGREAMIEAGVHDEYTRATNAADVARSAQNLLKGLFRKP